MIRRLTEFLKRKADLARRFEAEVSERSPTGFVGGIPYLLMFRGINAALVGAVALFAGVGPLTSLCLFVAALCQFLYATYRSYAERRETFLGARDFKESVRLSVQRWLIFSEVALTSVVVVLGHTRYHDVYLLFLVPIFAAILYFDGTNVVGFLIVASSANGLANAVLDRPQAFSDLLVQTGFLWLIALLLWVYTRMIFLQRLQWDSEYITTNRLLECLTLVHDHAGDAYSLHREMNLLIRTLCDVENYSFVTISLVDEYRRSIETVKGSDNVPPGWIRRSSYSLDKDEDIQVHVANTGDEVVVRDEPHPLFNMDIYRLYEHERYHRFFMPLVQDGYVIGTIDVGVVRENARQKLSARALERVREIASKHGPKIGAVRPIELLEAICAGAAELVSADSASIHLYRRTDNEDEELIMMAGAGCATSDFLRKFPRRAGGIGELALLLGEPKLLDNESALRSDRPDLYAAGVRSMGAFPVGTGSEHSAVLYVHFWRVRTFESRDRRALELFARHIQIVIKDYMSMVTLSRHHELVWHVNNLHRVLLALGSSDQTKNTVGEIARSMLYALDADSVTLYRRNGAGKLETPPYFVGSIRKEEDLLSPVGEETVVAKLLTFGYPMFFETIGALEGVVGLQGAHTFVGREGVKSLAFSPLKVGFDEHIDGCIFVNYRRARRFRDDSQFKDVFGAMTKAAAIALRQHAGGRSRSASTSG